MLNFVSKFREALCRFWSPLPWPAQEWERGNFNCPVCGFLTLHREEQWPELCQWDICPICFWEDDSEYLGGGANHGVDVATARLNYQQCGAMLPNMAHNVRPPTKAEREGWQEPPDAMVLIDRTRRRYEQVGGDIIRFYCKQ